MKVNGWEVVVVLAFFLGIVAKTIYDHFRYDYSDNEEEATTIYERKRGT